MHKAWSLLQVKSVDDEARIIRGIATTPTMDRVGDIVEPMGVVFRGAVKLHLYHKHDLPVGLLNFDRPTKSGIPFEATIPDVREEGTVKERVNEAWHSVKYKLLDAVSIGFNVLEGGVEIMKNGGLRFTKWEMLELSLVGVPANPEAVITAFKSCDPARIRSSLHLPLAKSNGAIQLLSAQGKSVAARPEGGAIKLVTS